MSAATQIDPSPGGYDDEHVARPAGFLSHGCQSLIQAGPGIFRNFYLGKALVLPPLPWRRRWWQGSFVLPPLLFPRFGKSLAGGPGTFGNLSLCGVQGRLVLPPLFFPCSGESLADGPGTFGNLSFGGVQSSFVLLPLFFPRFGKNLADGPSIFCNLFLWRRPKQLRTAAAVLPALQQELG